MEELRELKLAIIKMLMDSEDLDECYLRSRGEKFSRQQLAEQIEQNTEVGNMIVKDLVLLATDLVIREKKSI